MIASADLEIRHPIVQFVEAYQRAMRNFQEGFEQACRARLELERLLEGGQAYDNSDWDIRDLQKKKTISLRRKAWDVLLNRMGVDKFLSSKRHAQMSANLESEDAPDITIEAVVELLDAMQSNDLAREVVLEAFEELRPGKYRSNCHKTNAKEPWKVTSKIVLTWMVRPKFGGGFQAAHGSEIQLAVIDRAFHLLDGALADFDSNSYRSPLVDAIQTSKDGRGETKYFRFQCYRNGNLHLQIKRLDLLKELNRIGGEGRAELGGGR